MWKAIKCWILGHNWIKYRFNNYIDTSYESRVKSHDIYYFCSRCDQTKEKMMYGAGWIESLDDAK